MSASFESDSEEEINIRFGISVSGLLDAIENNPALLQKIATLARNEIVGPMARRMGNTADKTAQKKTPLAAKPQVPGTQRVF